jgi:hypothetical protein
MTFQQGNWFPSLVIKYPKTDRTTPINGSLLTKSLYNGQDEFPPNLGRIDPQRVFSRALGKGRGDKHGQRTPNAQK